jgi:murein DD-endopeptidase MepM/ murein hydrolase activator NlpD
MLRVKVIGVFIVSLAAVLLTGRALGSRELRDTLQPLLLPYRLARLQIEPPDQALPVPVRGVRPRQIADTWGAPRFGDRRHRGQDIFAPKGTPVVSATRGVVTRVGENRLGGNTVSVFGPGGRRYYYAHLDRYAAGLRAGDVVSPGTVLGYVGNTGNARGTPPHLHFGVYGPGGPLDPLPLISEKASAAAPASD